MAIRFDCPNCKTNYEVADDLAGKMIMCRGCQKRGAVRGLSSSTAAAKPPAAGMSSSRRNFLISGIAASVVAITTGALLARRPWRYLASPETPSSERGPGRRPLRRPPDDGKEGDKKSPGV